MSEAVQLALIVAVPLYITTLAGVYIQLRNLRHEMNGMKDALVAKTDEAADARGQLTGATNEQARIAGLAAIAATQAQGELAGVASEQARVASMIAAEAVMGATEKGAVIPGSRIPTVTVAAPPKDTE